MSSASKRQLADRLYIVAGVAVALGLIGGAWHVRRPLGPVHLIVAAGESDDGGAQTGALRVCADPNNLPFSNDRGEGFENKIAELAAHDLGKTVSYYFRPPRETFIRATLNAGA